MELSNEYLARMKQMLGSAFADYEKSLSEPPVQGLRVNTAKITAEEFARLAPFPLRPVPWAANGFYTEPGSEAARHPYYYAGLYYIQEPSAMLPAALLDAQPDDAVLDLCAAPGGKATEIGSRLTGAGFVVANDISSSRAKALLKNLEMHGIGNFFVCSETPKKLLEKYGAAFDKILVDAPCSGEGMFRKDASAVKAYASHGPSFYAPIQRELLEAAVQMLKPGGRLVYSTCTFAEEENEQTVLAILKKYPQMRLVPALPIDGAVSLPSLPGCVRLFPHLVQGEGHFAAILQKDGEKEDAPLNARRASASWPVQWQEFAEHFLHRDFSSWEPMQAQERLYALPAPKLSGIRYLRTGLYLGDLTKHGFVPSQPLAMHLKKEDAVSVVSFSADDARVLRYLKGETVDVSEKESEGLRGWTLVCADGYPLGWAKPVNGSLRNKYYAGWRMS